MTTQRQRTFYERFVKRFLDIILSLLALVILSPVLLVIAICSKIFIRGKIIFAQSRPGRNGQVFKLYKFKSMTDKTDAEGNLLPDAERITGFGRLMRKLSLDELPQLWNILRGDMSIVGPRPRLVSDTIFYPEAQFTALEARPGLTSLANVSGGRSSASWEDIFASDQSYAEKITFLGDLKIIFKTVVAVFKSDAASDGASGSKREYYYGDYLLKSGKITKEQYDLGHSRAKQIIVLHGRVGYCPDLQPAIPADETKDVTEDVTKEVTETEQEEQQHA